MNQTHERTTDGADNPPLGHLEIFEWSVWDPHGGEVATGLTDSEPRARQRVTDEMRARIVAVTGTVALVDLDDGRYELRSVANAYRNESDEILWDNLELTLPGGRPPHHTAHRDEHES